ncbi:unnamed protein product [Bursaphelenchus xylophilus]|uniref:Short-chain dehydrogenase/reductase 3 n=1 Tax=Bursaphelenchus xylophilus TaxID=6326 RepID=A0A7I8X2T6_BURXY|nr:unnamed protein product [Bursaphelenchus xylophilus]CAG9128024.1 unnamed protein product [Bursaphelenchus xylophilus]
MKRKGVENQIVVITGGASGIGRRVAQILAVDEKATVVILDVNKDAGDATVQEITSNKGKAVFYKCNVGNWEDVNECAKKILQDHGPADIVVCNAAIAQFGHFLNFSDNDMRRVYDVNVFGVMNTIRAFLPQFEANNKGHIVAMSSIAGHFGETYGAAYCPTKFAVRGLMESLQMEFRDRGLTGIKTTTLFPYFTDTPLVQSCTPKSTFISCMKVEYCARVTVESILKERVISYIPRWIFFMGVVKGQGGYSVFTPEDRSLMTKHATNVVTEVKEAV